MFRRFLSCALAAAVAGLSASTPAATAADLLTIGSEAPALDIEHWVQDGNGKFKPVTKFEDGKVYVVEFWATWCGPCRMSMPHLAEVQTKFADKGVQIVSISDEELPVVDKFLSNPVNRRGPAPAKEGEKAEPKTYRELTSAYCLTTDPDRSCHEAYMTAAVQQGIPSCFIVGKDHKIEWIGHPMNMDEPLEQILVGKWDRNKFAEEFKPQQELDWILMQAQERIDKGDIKGALALVEDALTKVKGPQAIQLKVTRLQLMMVDKSSAAKLPEALSETLVGVKDNPTAVSEIVWNIVINMEQGRIKKDQKLIDIMLPAIKKASEKGEGDDGALVLETLAHLQKLTGDLDGAIKTQKSAIEMAKSLKDQLKPYLTELEQAKKP